LMLYSPGPDSIIRKWKSKLIYKTLVLFLEKYSTIYTNIVQIICFSYIHIMVYVPAVHLLLKKLESLGHCPSVAMWKAFPCWCTVTQMKIWGHCEKYSFTGLWVMQWTAPESDLLLTYN
jgi:hypothetical protein